MKIGKEVSYLKTKVGKLSLDLSSDSRLIIIQSDDLETNIYNREKYETFLLRIQKIDKLLQIN